MDKSNFGIELMPKGKFLITLESGIKVKGRFSMYALDRFAEAKGAKSYADVLVKITMGMSIREYAELVVYALEDYYRDDTEQCRVMVDGSNKRWTADLVMDLIFESMGGLGNKTSLDFFKHAVGRLTEIVEEQPGDEKKNQGEEISQSPSAG